ncbi:sigma factor-like helix-turn-helix DNA-binding protein [Thiocapsa sp. N5-Cardenillas]|uniref:sigma factor-like helix-turn-helix DNA-binding protein n=1 Tax=Thiocapsa sp. N5-Cardenillas TaxID=3137397 RepID=UPI0035B28F4A
MVTTFASPPVLDSQELFARARMHCVHELMRSSEEAVHNRARFFRHWTRIACIRAWQREFGRRSRKWTAMLPLEDALHIAAPERLPNQGEPEYMLPENDRWPVLMEAFEKLTPSYKEMIMRHYLEGQSIPEIAAARGQTEGGAAAVVRKAKWALRRIVVGGAIAASSLAASAQTLPPQPATPPRSTTEATTNTLYQQWWRYGLALRAIAEAQQTEIAVLKQRIEALEAAPAPEQPGQKLVKMVWRWVEGYGRDSVYYGQFSPISEDEWQSLPPWPGTGEPPVPEPQQPLSITPMAFVAWGEPNATEWKAFGSPRPSGDSSIGWFAPQNWLEYSVPAGKWSGIRLRVSNPAAGAQITVSSASASVTIDVPNTGSWATQAEIGGSIDIQGPTTIRVTGSRASDGYWTGDLHAITLQP